MATRGLTGFRLNGKLYAMYNHFDSDPEWLGQSVLEFCKQVDWDNPIIAERVAKIILVNDVGIVPEKFVKKYQKYSCNEFEKTIDWYWLLRDLQGVGILEKVVEGKVKHMIDNADFLGDEISCEWAYIINLDENELEVWHKAKNLYNYNLFELPMFMLGVTNKFKDSYSPIFFEVKL